MSEHADCGYSLWLITCCVLTGSGPGEKASDRLVSSQLREAAQSQHQQDNAHRAHPS